MIQKVRTEAEASAELGFSIHKMRKLRAAGEVAFIPGRPVLILERDFEDLKRREAEKAYVRWEKRKRKKRGAKPLKPPEDPDAAIRWRAALCWLKLRAKSGQLPTISKPATAPPRRQKMR